MLYFRGFVAGMREVKIESVLCTTMAAPTQSTKGLFGRVIFYSSRRAGGGGGVQMELDCICPTAAKWKLMNRKTRDNKSRR